MFRLSTILPLWIPFLLQAHLGLAQVHFWEQTGGPSDAYVTALAFRSDVLFAGTQEGILRSTDWGESWQQTGFSSNGVRAILITPQGQVFVGAAGVHRSTDNGTSWTRSLPGRTE